jgi:GGDEF domain-containing protein
MTTAQINQPAPTGGAIISSSDMPPLLALGDTPPLVPGIDFDARLDAPFAGIVLLGPVEPAVLADALDAASDPAVPIADIGGNRELRSDFTSDALDGAVTAQMRHCFAPIRQRLEAIPFSGAHEDRADLTILRLAYSRNTAIAATFDPASRNAVEYPLLGHGVALRQRLEGLAALDLLHRRHFTRTHLCARCDSARLHAYEACPGCGSADLFETAMVHHYRCGWQEPEPHFVKDHALVCPKCRRELRHYGVDYDKPGSVLLCRNCHTANSEPTVQLACLDCGHVTPGSEAHTLDWYHYDLTDVGLEAMREGRIPRFDIDDHLDGHPRAFALRDFRLLADEGMRVARRYGRPFAVGTLTFGNARTLRADHGHVTTDLGFRRAVDTIVESLRDSDFIAVDASNRIFIGFPETAETQARAALQRLAADVSQAAGLPFAITFDAAEGDHAGDLLAQAAPS